MMFSLIREAPFARMSRQIMGSNRLPHTLIPHPRHPYTKFLLGAAPAGGVTQGGEFSEVSFSLFPLEID